MAKAHEHGYSIGEAARASGVNAKTIRYYEDIGLIPRARRRTAHARTGGDRVYSESDIGRLRFICQARLVDLNLDDIRELLKIADKGCPSTNPAYTELLKRHVRRVDESINHLLVLRSMVHQLLSRTNAAHGSCCTWETCGCMHAERSPKAGAATAA